MVRASGFPEEGVNAEQSRGMVVRGLRRETRPRDSSRRGPAALCVLAVAQGDPGCPAGPHARGHAWAGLRAHELPSRRVRRVLPVAERRDEHFPGRPPANLPGARGALRLLRMVGRLREAPAARRPPQLRRRHIPRGRSRIFAPSASSASRTSPASIRYRIPREAPIPR